MLARVKDNDVIHVEEAHTLGGSGKKAKHVQAVLLELIENGKILGGGGQFSVIEAPKVSFVLPTTSPGKLSEPLRTRCRILFTHYYTVEQIEQILLRAARKIGLDISKDKDALRLLAKSCRGSPRIAVMQRLDGLANIMAVDKLKFTVSTVQRFFALYEINEWGLEATDIQYCQTLYHKVMAMGRPISKKTMEQTLGIAEDMLSEVIENYLIQIGAIVIETKGRMITDKGCEMIGMPPIRFNSLEQLAVKQAARQVTTIDTDKLEELLADPDIRRKGMKGVCAELGLRYGPDNERLQQILAQLGWVARQRAGIVPLEK